METDARLAAAKEKGSTGKTKTTKAVSSAKPKSSPRKSKARQSKNHASESCTASRRFAWIIVVYNAVSFGEAPGKEKPQGRFEADVRKILAGEPVDAVSSGRAPALKKSRKKDQPEKEDATMASEDGKSAALLH